MVLSIKRKVNYFQYGKEINWFIKKNIGS